MALLIKTPRAEELLTHIDLINCSFELSETIAPTMRDAKRELDSLLKSSKIQFKPAVGATNGDRRALAKAEAVGIHTCTVQWIKGSTPLSIIISVEVRGVYSLTHAFKLQRTLRKYCISHALETPTESLRILHVAHDIAGNFMPYFAKLFRTKCYSGRGSTNLSRMPAIINLANGDSIESFVVPNPKHPDRHGDQCIAFYNKFLQLSNQFGDDAVYPWPKNYKGEATRIELRVGSNRLKKLGYNVLADINNPTLAEKLIRYMTLEYFYFTQVPPVKGSRGKKIRHPLWRKCVRGMLAWAANPSYGKEFHIAKQVTTSRTPEEIVSWLDGIKASAVRERRLPCNSYTEMDVAIQNLTNGHRTKPFSEIKAKL